MTQCIKTGWVIPSRTVDCHPYGKSLDAKVKSSYLFKSIIRHSTPKSIAPATPAPTSTEQAGNYPDRNMWSQANDLELKQLGEHQTVEWIHNKQLPPNTKAITNFNEVQIQTNLKRKNSRIQGQVFPTWRLDEAESSLQWIRSLFLHGWQDHYSQHYSICSSHRLPFSTIWYHIRLPPWTCVPINNRLCQAATAIQRYIQTLMQVWESTNEPIRREIGRIYIPSRT